MPGKGARIPKWRQALAAQWRYWGSRSWLEPGARRRRDVPSCKKSYTRQGAERDRGQVFRVGRDAFSITGMTGLRSMDRLKTIAQNQKLLLLPSQICFCNNESPITCVHSTLIVPQPVYFVIDALWAWIIHPPVSNFLVQGSIWWLVLNNF